MSAKMTDFKALKSHSQDKVVKSALQYFRIENIFKKFHFSCFPEKNSFKFVTSNRQFWLKFSWSVYKRVSLFFFNDLVFVTS